jgi:hypothetical protein
MTPTQQRNLIIVLLTVGFLIVVIITVIALTSSQRDIQIAAPADGTLPSGGFTFFDLNRTTVLNRGIRKTLSEMLGSDAIAHATPIDLTVVNQGFLQTHLPVLDTLNQRLNPAMGERREHDTTRLTYHRAEQHQMPFRYIALFFSNITGQPLYFIIHPTEDFADSIATLTSKYGPPRIVKTEKMDTPVRLWEQDGDILVATTFPRRNGRMSQELRIYFVANLKQLVESEEQTLRRQDSTTRQAGERAF